MRIAAILSLAGIASALALSGCSPKTDAPAGGNSPAVTTHTGAPPGKMLNVYMLPKKKGLAYFTSCADGAQQAAKELGDVNLVYDGPTDGAAEKAASMIETWTLKGADAIAVSPNDPAVLAPAMKAAQAKGIPVLTWDADGAKDSRGFFVNQATSQQIGAGAGRRDGEGLRRRGAVGQSRDCHGNPDRREPKRVDCGDKRRVKKVPATRTSCD